jgi:arylsulfatase A-like enzyme
MEEMGLLENTWIMVTSAHGEEIFDHNSIDHGHRYEEEVIRVPLIIRAPGGKWNAGVRLATSVRHIDVAPTIMALFGVSPQETFEGESLMPVIKGEQKTHRPAFTESNIHWFERYAWIDGRYKLIKPVPNLPGVLFDLEKDPGERMEISPPHPIYKRLLKASENYIRRLNQRKKQDPGSSGKHLTQPPKKPHPSSSSKGSSPE